jgi:hypothetical protein
MFGLFGKSDPTHSNPTQESIHCPPIQQDLQCAWCNEEQGIPQGEGTHGICTPHAQEQYQRYRASRVARH